MKLKNNSMISSNRIKKNRNGKSPKLQVLIMENQLFANKKKSGKNLRKISNDFGKKSLDSKSLVKDVKALKRCCQEILVAFQEDAGFGMIENHASFPNSMKMPSRKIFGSLERMLEELN